MAMTNAEARLLFLSSAIRKSQYFYPTQAPALGGVMTFVLPKAGIARGILLNFSVPLTMNAVHQPNVKSPFNFVTNVQVNDYNGIQRVNCSGWGLYLLSLLKKRMWDPGFSYPFSAAGPGTQADPYAANAAYPFGAYGQYSTKTAEGGAINPQNSYFVANRWNIPTASAGANLVFSLWVPLAFDMNDPRGSVLLNVPNGQVQMLVTINSALVAASGVDQLYTDGNAAPTLNSPTTTAVTATLYYWDPIPVPGVDPRQFEGGIPIPYDDLQLVHEIKSLTDTTGIAQSTEKQYTMPSGRDYYRVIGSLVNNGGMASSGITRTRWVYDGNTPTFDELTAAHQTRAQYELGRDLPEGMTYYDFADRPWDSNAYGALGLFTTFSGSINVTAPTYQEIITDSLYLATQENA